MNEYHIPVLAEESIELLDIRPEGSYADLTFGGGGHSSLILSKLGSRGRLYAFDQDADAKANAERIHDDRFTFIESNFRFMRGQLRMRGVETLDGVFADLGVSSHHFDTPERGFSFRYNAPLDMRMDTRAAFSARNLVNEAPEEEIADILWQFGEERASRAIARAIVKARSLAPITTTAQLARVVESVLPRKGRQHPGTRTFQALRIAVNGELDALDALLDSSVRLLGKGGRMAVITFHSLEDRRVKQFFDLRSRPEIDRPEWPAPRPNPDYCFRLLSRKPVTAGEEELSTNPRSRSAKLRGVEKII